MASSDETEKSEIVDNLLRTENPDYRIVEIVNVIPFQSNAEMIGKTAGRVYFRERNKLYAVVMSSSQMLHLSDLMREVLAANDDC